MSDDDFWGGGGGGDKSTKKTKIVSSASEPQSSSSHSRQGKTTLPKSRKDTPSPDKGRRYSRSKDDQVSKDTVSDNSGDESDAKQSEDENNSDQESDHDNATHTRSSVGSGGSEDGGESRTEDDPLSDVWDSEDADDSNSQGSHSDKEESLEHQLEEVQNPQYDIVTVKTGRGIMTQVNLTPPTLLLQHAEKARKVYYRKRMEAECVKECVRCLALTRIIHGDRAPWLMAHCHAWIAKAYWELKEYPLQTQYHAEEAKKLMLRTEEFAIPKHGIPPEKTQLLETLLLTYYLLGKAQLALKKVGDAEWSLRKAEKVLHERKELGGMKDRKFWTTELYTALARVKVCESCPQEANQFLKKVLKLLQRKYGQESTKLIPMYKEMAKIEESRNEDEGFENAVEYAMKAYSIAKSAYEDTGEEVGDSVLSLGLTYAKLEGEEAEIYAESYLNEAINCFQLTHGNNHAKTLKAQEHLAKQLATKGRASEAVTLFSATLPSYVDTFGELSGKTATAYRLLAGFCLQTGNTSEGSKYLKKVLHLEMQIYGKSHAKTQQTQKALSVLLKNPKLNEKHGDNKLKDRPRFQTMVKIAGMVGGFKSAMPDY